MGAAVESAMYTAKPSPPPPMGFDREKVADKLKDDAAFTDVKATAVCPTPDVSVADDGDSTDAPAPEKAHFSRLFTCGDAVAVAATVDDGVADAGVVVRPKFVNVFVQPAESPVDDAMTIDGDT